ncbi:endopeptidase La [candidate division KSB1 bacterium]|nr:endopeptidase La [candidate division KSB1 bacterium]
MSIRDSLNIPKALPIIPLRNAVLFPNQFLPISVAREKSMKILQETSLSDSTIAILTQNDASVDNPRPDEMFSIGTEAKIMRIIDMPDGSKTVLLQGINRVKVITFLQESPYYKAAFQPYTDTLETNDHIDALMNNLRRLFRRVVELSNEASYEQVVMIQNIKEPGTLADMVAAFLNIPLADKKTILEAIDIEQRLQVTNELINKHSQTLELGEKIQSDIKSKFDKTQREMFLREQLTAIRKELGDESDNQEIKEIREKIVKAKLPEEAQKVAEKELDRLSQMHPSSAEYTVSRTYLDWLTELPWSIQTEDNLDIRAAEKNLNQDHYGLTKVKERILEYLAVRKLKSDMRGPILCFVGPPGVGKTSLGRSIAEALGRKFIRISLGGVRDEAEIRGHRRTYIGALPGRIIKGIKRAGTNNPVFMLDEIDKLGNDFRGDPSSALLEVLDPEQNFSFSDHYLEVPFDLSKVMFIATANVTYTIPPALRDRMEIIEIPSYIVEEKLNIAKQFLVPRQLTEHGLKKSLLQFQDDALRSVIQNYTKEAGVRNLEREIATICRKVATDFAKGNKKGKRMSSKMLSRLLGPPRFYEEAAERLIAPGIAIGMAWTPVGGDILFIEASKMPGKGNLILTGQLGDVMKESAQAAMSYIRSHADDYKIDPKFNEVNDIHIHVPSGSVPKDGPSAGVTLFTSLISLLSGKKVSSEIAMTGEITLRGSVLPVGGIKEKVLAAHRSGIKNIILPAKNEKDLIEVPKQVQDDLKFYFVKQMSEVIPLALEAEAEPAKNLQLASREKKNKVKAEPFVTA